MEKIHLLAFTLLFTVKLLDGACTKEDLLTAVDDCSPDLFKKIESKLATDNDEFSLFNLISALDKDDWTYFCNKVNTTLFISCLFGKIELCTDASDKETNAGYFTLAKSLIDGTCPKYTTTTPKATPTTTVIKTTTPGCRQGETKDEGQSGNWCYGKVCNNGEWMAWDNFNCNPTTTPKTTTPVTTIPTVTTTPVTTIPTVTTTPVTTKPTVTTAPGRIPTGTTTKRGSSAPTTPGSAGQCELETGESLRRGARVKLRQSGHHCSGVQCSSNGSLVSWEMVSCPLSCNTEYLGFVMKNCAPAPVNTKLQRHLRALQADANIGDSITTVMSALTKAEWQVVCSDAENVSSCVQKELEPCDMDKDTQLKVNIGIAYIKLVKCSKVTTTTVAARTRNVNIVSKGIELQSNLLIWIVAAISSFCVWESWSKE